MLNKKEQAALNRLNRKIFGGRATRKEVLRAFALTFKKRMAATQQAAE